MTTSVLVHSCVLIAALGLVSSARADDGLAVMKQVEASLQSAGQELAVTMEVTGSGGAETRTFRMWTQAMPEQPSRNLIRFETPGNIAGTALLSVQRPGKRQDSWLYVPALDQVRRIAPADRSESFVGSDFTIEDLTVAVDNEAREYTVLGEVACGEGRTCVQLQDAPRTAAAAKSSGYGRVVLYVDTEHHVTWQIDFYDKADGLLKVLKADGLVQVGEAWRFDKATVANLQSGSRTVMTVTARGTDKLDASIFSPSALDSW